MKEDGRRKKKKKKEEASFLIQMGWWVVDLNGWFSETGGFFLMACDTWYLPYTSSLLPIFAGHF